MKLQEKVLLWIAFILVFLIVGYGIAGVCEQEPDLVSCTNLVSNIEWGTFCFASTNILCEPEYTPALASNMQARGMLWEAFGGDTGIVCTVETWVETNEHGEVTRSQLGQLYWGDGTIIETPSDPKKRVVTTVVERITRLRFEWAGEEWIATKRKELSRKEKRMVKKETWVEE